jgi:SAM-dependent methyltransferase
VPIGGPRPLRRSRAWSAANPGNRAARGELLAAILTLARSQVQGRGALLDCGCGTGWLLEALADAGVDPGRLHGVDASPVRVEATARRVPGAAVLTADARALPYPDAAFDAVFHVVSLSSIGPPESVRAALTDARRVLSPGGILVVYEPRLPNPLNRATRRVGRADFERAGLAVSRARALTLLPPLGRRLGPLSDSLHPRLSRLPVLRSHELLVHCVPRR